MVAAHLAPLDLALNKSIAANLPFFSRFWSTCRGHFFPSRNLMLTNQYIYRRKVNYT
jgi:hypothetical protein